MKIRKKKKRQQILKVISIKNEQRKRTKIAFNESISILNFINN